MKFLESLKIKVFYYDPYLTEKFSAQKVETFDKLILNTDIIFLSYIDPHFNPILQIKQEKKIWDLWHHFSDSKYNKIFHKDSDFKKFNIIDTQKNEKIIQFNKKLG